jgi:hypothetical protein
MGLVRRRATSSSESRTQNGKTVQSKDIEKIENQPSDANLKLKPTIADVKEWPMVLWITMFVCAIASLYQVEDDPR